MKKITIMTKLFCALALFVAVAFNAKSVSYAQGGLTYTSGVQIQNLGNATANVIVDFISQSSGLSVGTSSSITITVGSSKTFFPVTNAPGISLASFNGSLVVASDQPVVAIANLTANNFAYLDTTSGFTQGSTTFNLPLIMCNNGGFNTFFNVQNTGSSDANVTINFKPGSSGNAVVMNDTIKPGAAKTYDQDATSSSSARCGTGAGQLGSKFVGGVSISSTQPVVASVVQLNTTATTSRQMIAYDGFASAATQVAAPLLMANNGGFSTGLQIANTSASTANVTVAFSSNTVGNTNRPVTETLTIAAGASATLIQSGGISAFSPNNDWTAFGRYIGSASITSDQPIVAIVNQVTTYRGAAYQARPTSTGSATVKLPLLSANNAGFSTGVQIQNVGGSACNGQMTFSANTVVNTNIPATESFNIQPGASVTFLQSGASGALSPNNDWNVFGRYVGSATVSGAGCSLIAIVNQSSTSATLDNFSSYNGFNQ